MGSPFPFTIYPSMSPRKSRHKLRIFGVLKLGMDFKDEKFSVVIPATIEKSEEGDWRVFGLASTPKRDLQGEVVSLKGLDLSPIEKGRGVFNFDHKKGPENTIG